MNPPEYEYTGIEELAKRWNLTPREMLEYCRKDNLKILINWRRNKRQQFNVSCFYKDDWMPVPLEHDFPLLRVKSLCEGCQHSGNKSVCNFEYPEEYLQGLNQDEHDCLGNIYINQKKDLWVSQAEVERFEKAQGRAEELTSIPPCLQPETMYHSKAMMAMAAAWISIFEKKEILDATSCKQSVIKYINKNYSERKEYTTMTYRDNPFNKPKVESMGALLNTCISETDWNKFVKDNKKK